MTPHKAIASISRQWKSLVWAKILLAGALTTLAIWLAFAHTIPWSFYPPIGLAAFGSCYLLFRRAFPSRENLIALVNEQFPEIQYSTSLVYQQEVTGLAALQQRRAHELLQSKLKGIRYPVSFRDLIWILVFGALIIAATQLPRNTADEPDTSKSDLPTAIIEKDTDYSYTATVSIRPPAYTGLPAKSQTSLHLEKIPSGSEVVWSFVFSSLPENAWLQFSHGDSLPIKNVKVRHKAVGKGFYTLNFIDPQGKAQTSDYFKLDVVIDRSPEITISGAPPYQSFYPGQKAAITFTTVITDDYGLTDAYVVATITRGAGESIKFREQKLPFSRAVRGRRFTSSMQLSADQFDMEPGNELYFYVEAHDNQNPPKVSKTETYFFILKDTSETTFSLEGTLGVDLMPEYFRSQRQIIIDSEKLLTEKQSISKEAFFQRSNELAFDQKALRLKYGQFLGEEAESGPEAEHEAEEESEHHETGEVDVLSEYGHDHDHENEAGQLLDKGTEPAKAIAAELSHSHDDAEQATFFEESMKTKLKAALTEMWDAELYLRLSKPELSLPYQYRALELLKEIKNDARIYVHRMGFDPPPINEKESRLTGELDEVHGEAFYTSRKADDRFPEIRKAILQISKAERGTFPIKNELRAALQAAGNEVAQLAIETPGKYLRLLTDLRNVADMEAFQHSAKLAALKLELLDVLKVPMKKPVLHPRPDHLLIEEFVNEITKKAPR